MTAKEYLSQARHIDLRINSKIQQVTSLNDLATKATAVLTGMPHSLNRATSTMEEAIALEKRYLCFLSWEQIAVDIGYSIHHLYKLHSAALNICDRILKEDT